MGSGSSSSNPAPSPNGPQIFNLMVQGDNETLLLYTTELPQRRLGTGNSQTDNDATLPDLRRIGYWLVPGGKGLARQVLDGPTSTDVQSTGLPDLTGLPEQEKYIIARDVTSVTFQYWDGSQYQDTWDGTQVGSDGMTPIGPPLAIAVTVEVRQNTASLNGEALTKTFKTVIPLQAANGIPAQASNITGQ
jgi:hypothetical protein